jgi:DNA adenine methylase
MLRYPGGKTRAIKDLLYIMKEENVSLEKKTVYSPFYGGGSFEKYLHDNFSCTIIANDLFNPLYTFWNCLKHDRKKLKKEIQKLHPLSKEKFTELRGRFQTYDEFKMASAYFALNRSSFSGTTTSGGYSKQAAEKRFTQSSIDRIDNYNMDNITFYNKDFSDFIPDVVSENQFMFLDPPYHIKSKLYGNKGDLHSDFDHKKLATILSSRKNWMLCYNDDEYINNLYKDIDGVEIYEASWSYGMNKSKKSSEIVIIRV